MNDDKDRLKETEKVSAFRKGFMRMDDAIDRVLLKLQLIVYPHKKQFLYERYGNIAFHKQYFRTASHHNMKLIEMYPNRADYHLSNIVILNQMGRADEALHDLSKMLEDNPQEALYHNARGVLLAAAKQYDEALLSFDKAINIAPDDARYYIGRGNMFLNLKRYDESLVDNEKVIELMPKNAIGYINRSTVLICMKQYREALKDTNMALTLEKNAPEATANAAEIYYKLKDFDSAIDLISKYIKDYEAFGDTYSIFGLAIVYKEFSQKGHIDEQMASKALKYLNMGIEKDSTFYERYLQRAEFYLLTDQLDKAFEDIEKAKSLDVVGYPDIYHLLARVYEAQGDEVKAKENYDKADELGYIPEPDEDNE